MTLTDIERQAVDNPQPSARQHIEQYLRTNGEDLDHSLGDRMILLYTRGRRSGKIRRVPVVHIPDGDDLIVIASKGGAPQHPAWFFNLEADPQVWVRRKSEFFEARAVVLEGEDHEEMWARVVEWAPGFQQYQDRTQRRIPLVRLGPV